MSKRGVALSFTLAVAVAGLACGHAEQQLVDQYFGATNTKDVQTVGGFALVGFDQKADKWSIESVDPESRVPARLPDLDKQVQAADAAVNANVKAAKAYSMDHFKEVDQIREIENKRGKVPASLAVPAAEWNKFNQNDRSLKKALGEAKEAAQKEKNAVVLSLVGSSEDISGLTGDEIDKKVNLLVTIAGTAKPYTMTLKRYELHDEGKSNNRMSRWIVAAIEPKAKPAP
jgi:hypothetical protein